MVFTAQQALDIQTSNLKISATGPVNTHNDVETISPSPGDLLSWNGTNWTNIPIPPTLTTQQILDIALATSKISADESINTHNDVETNNPSVGNLLAWDGTNWVNIPEITGISPQQTADIQTNNLKVSADGSISTHNDVQTQNISEGDLLSWYYPNWVNIPRITGITPQQASDIETSNLKISATGPVNTHIDVEINNPSTGDILSWDGTNWVNVLPIPGITPQQTTDILTNNGKISADGSINTHNDVETTANSYGDILSWNGTNWANRQFIPSSQTNLYGQIVTPISVCANITPIPNPTPLFGSHGPGSNTTDANRLLAFNWDGNPIYNPCGADLEQMYYALVKGGYIVGLEKEFIKSPPYSNNLSPTYSEQQNWIVRSINHVRKLLGNNTPIKLSQRLSNEALWRIEKAYCATYAPNDIYLSQQRFLPTLAQQAASYPNTLLEWPNGLISQSSGDNWRYELATGNFDNNTQPWWTAYGSVLWALLWHQQQSGNIWAQLFGREYIGIAIGRSTNATSICYDFKFSGPQQSLC